MNFSLPADYLAYKQATIDFARQELADDHLIERDKNGVFSRELWRRCADYGIFRLAATAEYGGVGEKINMLKAVVGLEGLGYGCRDNGLALGINAQLWSVQMTIACFGTSFQQEKYLRKMVTGEWIGCHALTEAAAGSDAFAMEMTATKVDGGYLLNGEKRLISLGPVADITVLFANAKPAMGKWGVTAFIIENDSAGCTVGPNQAKMGLRTVPFGKLTLKDCFVPDENRIGAEGGGLGICNHSLEYDRCGILASQLGTMERQLEETVAFARQRKVFNQPIGDFQSVSNRIADMKLRLETARLLLYQLAWMKDNDQSAMLESSMLKLYLSESFINSSLDALRIRGGCGYLTEHVVERDLRDAIGGVLYAGTSDIQRNIIAKMVGL